MNIIIVELGGAIGAICRYLITLLDKGVQT